MRLYVDNRNTIIPICVAPDKDTMRSDVDKRINEQHLVSAAKNPRDTPADVHYNEETTVLRDNVGLNLLYLTPEVS